MITPLSSYLCGWCTGISSLLSLYESLVAARESKELDQDDGRTFVEHLPIETVKRGLLEVIKKIHVEECTQMEQCYLVLALLIT